MLVGKTGSGKTSFSQAFQNQKLEYLKTQDINFSDEIIGRVFREQSFL